MYAGHYKNSKFPWRAWEYNSYDGYRIDIRRTNKLSNTLVFWSFTSGSPQKHVWGTKQVQQKSSRADIRCTRLRIELRVFFVSIGTLGLRIFGGRTNSSVFNGPERMVPGQVWMMDNFWEQRLLLTVFSNLLPSPNGYQIHAGFNL